MGYNGIYLYIYPAWWTFTKSELERSTMLLIWENPLLMGIHPLFQWPWLQLLFVCSPEGNMERDRIYWLVMTGTMDLVFYDFPLTVGNGIIIPTDVHSIIFQRGGNKPPTSFSMERDLLIISHYLSISMLNGSKYMPYLVVPIVMGFQVDLPISWMVIFQFANCKRLP